MNFTHSNTKEAAEIMKEAAIWLIGKDMALWPPDLITEKNILNSADPENVHVGWINEEPAATMILKWDDNSVWNKGGSNEAGYIHKLSIVRKYAGKGYSTKMIEYAEQKCKEKNINTLRLDCLASRKKLCNFYENQGFAIVSKVVINKTEMALFEKKF